MGSNIKLEWEIVLLKEALVLSSENCDMLLSEFYNVLKDVELEQLQGGHDLKLRVEELLAKTESLKKSNYLLVTTMTENWNECGLANRSGLRTCL